VSRSDRIVTALEVLVNGPPPVPVSSIPLSRARLCAERECSMVFSSDDSRACPACGSDSVSVATLAQTTSANVLEFRRLLSIRGREALLHRIARQHPDTIAGQYVAEGAL